MPFTQYPLSTWRKKNHTARQGRPGPAQRQQGFSRMALEQPDDTPLDQRLSRTQMGPRQMG